MNNKDLLNAIGEIDDKFIKEAAPGENSGQSESITPIPSRKPTHIWRYASVACAILALFGGLMVWQSGKLPSPFSSDGGKMPISSQSGAATSAPTLIPNATDVTGNPATTAPTLAPNATDTVGNSPTSAPSWAADTISVKVVNAKPLIAPAYDELNPALSAVAKGANDFAFRLSSALVNQEKDGNFVCSPYSVWLPLAALVNATDEQHKAQLLSALSANGLTEDDINQTASRMLYNLTNEGLKTNDEDISNPLKIANAIFVSNKLTLKQSFAQNFADYFRGSAINVDFGSKDAVDAVNHWADENTGGLIKEIIQEFDPNTVAAIANAIYFSDRWRQEFNADETVEDIFHAPNTDTQALYMLREGNASYYEDDKVQATPLMFANGGGMYIILPKDGDATGLLSSMTSEYFNKILADMSHATGKLLLPRFSIESEPMKLNDCLIALGVPLFDDIAAPLTNGILEENIPVWLAEAVQKAVIKVDEKGTTAAAVTVMGMCTTGIVSPTTLFEMNCNKPFVFVLFGNTYDGGEQILFTGVVNQP